MINPTQEFYGIFLYTYDYFNLHLFDGNLPNCMIVITRKKRTLGYFSPSRWVNDENEKTDEIAMNPSFFCENPLIVILQTMAHEMCHLWQHHFGKPSRRSYHNKEWGRKMKEIGLHPSNTGRPGGKETGQQMMDYPIKNGQFLEVSKKLIEENLFENLWYDPLVSSKINDSISDEILDFYDQFDLPLELLTINQNLGVEPTTKERAKGKYSCEECQTNVWGKPGLKLNCGFCGGEYFFMLG